MSEYGTRKVSGPGIGIFPGSARRIPIRNITAATNFTAGSVVMADVAQSLATSVEPGHSTSGTSDSIFNSCILPTTAGIAAGYPLFVCEEAIAAGATGLATQMDTSVVAKVGIASGDIGKGAPLVPVNGADVLVSTAGQAVAFMAQTLTIGSVTATSGSTQTCRVWFNGNWFK
jgi:hypothetical protein